MRRLRKTYFYKKIFSISCELIALVYLTTRGLAIWRWRWRSRRGDIDLVCSDLNDFVIVEVKGVTRAKEIRELIKIRQIRTLINKARSAALSLGFYPETGRLDLVVVDFSRIIPKIEWFQGIERFSLFPVLRSTDH